MKEGKRKRYPWPEKRIPFTFNPIARVIDDEWLAILSGSEYKVYSAINRRTWGTQDPDDRSQQKRKAEIPVEELAAAVGLKWRQVIRCTNALEAYGLLRITGPDRRFRTYEVLMPRRLGTAMEDSTKLAVVS